MPHHHHSIQPQPSAPLCCILASIALLLPACNTTQPRTEWTYDQGAPIRGDVRDKQLALVFTGGEHAEGTEQILHVLDELDTRASFFVTGNFLALPAAAGWVRRMVAGGHYVGPHSHAHLLYCAWEDRGQTLVSEPQFREDLQQNIDALRALGALPAGQDVYFIPPSEWYNAEIVEWARAMNVRLFNFTPGSGSNRDWIPESHPRFVSSQVIFDEILDYEQRDPHGLNGFVLLLHLGSQREDKMHELLKPLLVELRQRGYRSVRIDELLN